MKDSNGGDIPGTVLESTNASERLENDIINRFRCDSDSRRHQFSDECTSEPYYWRDNEGCGGVNPTHSLETGI